MNARPTAPAELPPAGIDGLDPDWSRLVTAPDSDGVGRTWHLLDNWASRAAGVEPALTLLCVHGNPSWSFLWRHLLTQVQQHDPERVRVIAVDQLDMGFSERTGVKRNLATRVEDLCQLTDTLGIHGPVITVAHDWGGPISLGWALRHNRGGGNGEAHRDDIGNAGSALSAHLAGVVLTNTAVHQPADSPAPAAIRLVRSRPLLRPATVLTGAFIQGAIEMSRPRLPADVRAGFHAPYRDQSRRLAIADFVADIPLDPEHESAAALDAIAAGLAELADIPALLLWGPKDRVFSDLYLHDLEARLPHAAVHRFPKAAHFVTEDADVAGAVMAWLAAFHSDASNEGSVPISNKPQALASAKTTTQATTQARPLADLSVAEPGTDAVVEIAPKHRAITFGELQARVDRLAAGMAAFGIQRGDRVAVMVTPGIDLALAVYGCWRLGATLVLVDSGLGRAGMQAALRSANPTWLIGIDKALIAAKLLGWPGKRIAVGARSALLNTMLNVESDLARLTTLGEGRAVPPYPEADTFAAVVFTSGSTGPSKGVVYRHQQVQAQRDALLSLYGITTDDRLVAAFAPFALYGPTLCITSIVPDMDVAAPGTLSAQALLDAVELVDATLVFASPAALVNIVATQGARRPAADAVRLVLSAGAPVRAELLRAASTIFTRADFHTPYGMTEMLPVADISLSELAASDDQHHDGGVCVGHPLPGLQLFIDPLDAQGEPLGMSPDVNIVDRPANPGVLGEIVVRAAHAREAYDRLWLTDHQASQPPGWHRTGDIGQLDSAGRLWVGGRLGHVITTPRGPLAPVSSEQRIERLSDISMAAVVGIGPTGTQAVVAVVQASNGTQPTGEASLALLDRIRQAVGDQADIVTALVVSKLPVDRRHNSKVDRTAVAAWAAKTLAGDRVASL